MTMSFFSQKYGIAHCHFCLFEKKFFNRHFGMTNAQTQEGIGLENAAAVRFGYVAQGIMMQQITSTP
jgi:hypothetical protein